MHGEGWRRLWELVKWLITIAVGVWCFISLMPTAVPAPDAVPSAGQILITALLITAIASAATFGFLHALEWVYRGFRPLPIAPTAEGHNTLHVEPSEPIPGPEQLPALPNPDSQRTT